jgi:hypothetical protein
VAIGRTLLKIDPAINLPCTENISVLGLRRNHGKYLGDYGEVDGVLWASAWIWANQSHFFFMTFILFVTEYVITNRHGFD